MVPLLGGSPNDIVDVGSAATRLIAYPEQWINRRVETVEILSREEMHRQASIDFTLSDAQLRELQLEDGVLVPISVLSKGKRRNFSLRDESGRAVPVLGRGENGDIAHAAMLNAASEALSTSIGHEDFMALGADLREIVCGDSDDAQDAMAYFIGAAESRDPIRAALWNDETCLRLLKVLRQNYVLFAVLDAEGPNRRILKFSEPDRLSRRPI